MKTYHLIARARENVVNGRGVRFSLWYFVMFRSLVQTRCYCFVLLRMRQIQKIISCSQQVRLWRPLHWRVFRCWIIKRRIIGLGTERWYYICLLKTNIRTTRGRVEVGGLSVSVFLNRVFCQMDSFPISLCPYFWSNMERFFCIN